MGKTREDHLDYLYKIYTGIDERNKCLRKEFEEKTLKQIETEYNNDMGTPQEYRRIVILNATDAGFNEEQYRDKFDEDVTAFDNDEMYKIAAWLVEV